MEVKDYVTFDWFVQLKLNLVQGCRETSRIIPSLNWQLKGGAFRSDALVMTHGTIFRFLKFTVFK